MLTGSQRPASAGGRLPGFFRAELQGFEALGSGGEAVFAGAVHLRRGGLEGLFRRDAFQPAVLRELFVVGKIEQDENANVLTAVFLFWRLAVEFEDDLVAEPKALLPAFQLVTRLLCRLFVRSEIEDEIRLRHEWKYSGTREELPSGAVR